MESLLGQIITFRSVTVFSIGEAWLLTKSSAESHLLLNILGILVLNYVLFVLYMLLIYNRFLSPLRSFPAPRSRSFREGFFPTVVSSNPGKRALEWASEPVNEEGVVLLHILVGGDALLATDHKALQEILVTNAYDWEKPARTRDFLRHVLGDGLIIVEGEQHKFQRKRVRPAFGFRQIKDLYPMMWKKAQAVTDAVNEDIETAGRNSIEIGHWASKVTLDIIGVAGLGREFNTLKNMDDPLVRDYEALTTPTFEKFLYFISRTLGPDKLVTKLPWGVHRVFTEATTSLRNTTRYLVQDKRAAMETGTSEHFDLLSLLIRSGDFSDDDLSDQLLTFLAAGHETTSSALTWTVFLLATHPEIQRQVREEVQSVLPVTEADLATALESLPLLNGVISETLRLYPTVPVTIRHSIRTTTLLGRSIPPGTDVVICPWATNRLPSIWGPDADAFEPRRWINQSDNTPNYSGGIDSNYSFLTFLHGPRSCIGQNFARAELRCLLAAFLGRFEWNLDMPVDKVIPAGVITIKPMNGLTVKLIPIQRQDIAGDI